MAGMLSDRVAIVTGASAGIGEAVVRDLATQGARLIINARRAEKLTALAGEINRAAAEERCFTLPGDCSDDAVIAGMMQAAENKFGRAADLVVVNAGRGLRGGVLDSDESQWEEVVRTNLLGAAKLIRVAANQMAAAFDPETWPGTGQEVARDIVVLGSNVGRHISPFSSMYGSTKFAVHSIAEAVRREVGPKGVRVSLIEPGIVKSEFQDSAGYDPVAFGEFMEKVGPVLVPEDIARTITFVVSQPAGVHVGDVLIRPTRQDYP